MLTVNVNSVHTSTYPFVCWDGFFSEEELVKIEEYFAEKVLEQGKIANDNLDTNVRNVQLTMASADETNRDLFDKLFQCAEIVNNHYYRYDITGFDFVQYSEYSENEFYDWHMDMYFEGVHPVPRKLSFSLILSNKDDYEGGDFEFCIGNPEKEGIKLEQLRGRIVAFPSFVIHRVTPVTKGVRKSLVFWVLGPKFK